MFDEGVVHVVYVHPFEYVRNSRIIGTGAEFVASYSCDECGFYGTQDGGMHPVIWARAPQPNCTVTDPIWKLLSSKNISREAISLTDFEECQMLYDYLETVPNTH